MVSANGGMGVLSVRFFGEKQNTANCKSEITIEYARGIPP